MLWILVVIAVAALVGFARGGKLANLVELRVSGLALLVVGFAMQFGSSFLPDTQRGVAVGLLLGSYLPILLFAWLNRQAAGMWIVGVGILMNFSVIALNGGMPVLIEAAELAGVSTTDLASAAKYVPLDQTTRLAFLADIIPLPGAVVSLGDVLLAVGLGVFLEDELRRPPRLFARGVHAVPGSAAER